MHVTNSIIETSGCNVCHPHCPALERITELTSSSHLKALPQTITTTATTQAAPLAAVPPQFLLASSLLLWAPMAAVLSAFPPPTMVSTAFNRPINAPSPWTAPWSVSDHLPAQLRT